VTAFGDYYFVGPQESNGGGGIQDDSEFAEGERLSPSRVQRSYEAEFVEAELEKAGTIPGGGTK